MTQEEFDYKHEENWQWYKLWQRLFYVAIPFFLVSLFFDNSIISVGILVFQCLMVYFMHLSKKNHDTLHDKWEEEGE